jgi:hypothetical protein
MCGFSRNGRGHNNIDVLRYVTQSADFLKVAEQYCLIYTSLLEKNSEERTEL